MTAGRKNSNVKSHHWGTPKKYTDAIREFFGTIELDPCSNMYSIVRASVEYMLPTNGLIESWKYKTIFVNPPYGRDYEKKTTIKNWLIRCRDAFFDGSEVIALIPVAPNTSHWKECIWGHASSICFLYDTRLKFLEDGIESKKGAPMACAIVYWGTNASKFKQIFSKFGYVVRLSE
jgi:hypothetical protein